MARPIGLSTSRVTAIREVSGVIAAENSTLSDANYAAVEAIDCAGVDSIFVGVEIDGGTAPTITIEPLFRDPDAEDGARWKRLLPQTTDALDGQAMGELFVYGRVVYLRRSAVTNSSSTTASRILVVPGRVRARAVYS